MGALAVLAIAFLLANLFQGLHRVIESSNRELAGVQTIEPLVRAVRHLQAHRGLSASAQCGNQEMKEQRAGS